MIEITSKKTGKVQIITNDQWLKIVDLKIDNRFNKKEIPERKLKEVPIVPPEVKTKTTKTK